MDISSVNSDLIRGNTTTIILGSLWSNDRYGYEILQEIDEKSNGQYKLKQATLYSQLKRLEKQGLISSYEGAIDDTGGGRRRYYALTAEGRAFLGKEKQEYEYSRTILDKLVSAKEFDFAEPAPFDTSSLRPYTKTEGEGTPKIIYKEKIVEKEVPVEVVKEVEVIKEVPVEILKEVPFEVVKEVPVSVEKRIYLDAYGNEITSEQAKILADRAKIADEERMQREREAMKPALSLSEMFARMDAESEYSGKLRNATADVAQANSAKEPYKPSENSYFTAYAGENESRTRSNATMSEIFARLKAKEAQIDSEHSVAKASSPVEKEPIYEEASFFDDEHSYSAQDVHDTPPTYSEPSNKDKFPKYSSPSKNYSVSTHNVAPQDFAQAEIERPFGAAPILPLDRDEFVTSAVISKRDEEFEYEKRDVNYRDFFTSIISLPEEKEPPKQKQSASSAYENDLKARLYAKGFKIRPYDRGNTSEYYTFNFVHSNRLNRDCWLIVLAIFLLEVGVIWASTFQQIGYGYFLPVLTCPAVLMLVPIAMYIANPTKRTRANFNFKLSILNRSMLFIELTVVCILIGFFAVGATVDDTTALLKSIYLPMVLLFNLPVSSVIYWLLYNSKRYHVA